MAALLAFATFASLLLPPAESAREEFVARFVARIEATGVEGEVRYDADDFAIRIGDAQTVFLENAFRLWKQTEPDRRDMAIDRFLDSVVTPGEADIPSTFEEARRRLLPVVRTRWFFALQATVPDAPAIARRPFAGTHATALVVDSPAAMAYVSERMLAEWEVSFERAYEAGMENLRAITLKRMAPVEPGFYVGDWGDGYDSSRVLLPELFRDLALDGAPVCTIPARNVLLVTGSRDEDGLEFLVRATQKMLERPRPQNGIALRLDDGAWSRFLPPPSTPGARGLRKLHTLARAGDAADQGRLLQARLDAAGETAFVAALSFIERDDGGLVTYAVWSKGIATILPRVDRVVFFDPDLGPEGEVIGQAPWRRVQGALTPEPGGADTEGRFRADPFPDEATLREWCGS